MRKIIFQIFALIILSIPIFAQDDNSQITLYSEQKNSTLHSVLIHAGGLADEVSPTKDFKMLVNIYGNNSDFLAVPYRTKAYVISQLKYNHKLPAEKFLVQNCDVHEKDLLIQIFKVPQNMEFETCEENQIIPTKSVLFESLYFHPEEDTLYDKAIEDTFIDLYVLGNPYSKTSLSVLLNLLNQSPESRVYLVAYLGTNLYGIGAENDKGETIIKDVRNLDKQYQAEKILNNIQTILKENGIESSKIETIEGGYREGQKQVEIWFVPKGGEIPKPKPDYFPNLNSKLGSSQRDFPFD